MTGSTISEQQHVDRAAPDGEPWPAAPRSATTAAADARLPGLHQHSGRPVVRDRWERLVTDIEAPVAPSAVWEALTDAGRLGEWFGVGRGRPEEVGAEWLLDFEDGEFFLCRTQRCEPPEEGRGGRLQYLWRWLGVGPATAVTWTVEASPRAPAATRVTVTEEAQNPPADWRAWNGGGWPGILRQLVDHLRTGTRWRWPWRRMGPYVQVEVAAPPFEAWEALTSPGAIKHWLQRTHGAIVPGDTVRLVMGDASGTVELNVHKHVEAGQEFPSYMPYVEFGLRRPGWDSELGGRLWIENSGLGRGLLQVFHHGWEQLPATVDRLAERRVLVSFWVDAMVRAQQMFTPQGPPTQPHGWT